MGLTERRRHERIELLDELTNELGWVRLTEGAASAPGFNGQETSPGSFVFDIDGVLLDTHKSFREVIPQSVNFFLEVILQEDTRAPLMRSEDVHLYKSAGGFNNDWDVAEAGLMHALWWSRSSQSAPSLGAFTRRIAERGGGLEGARKVMAEQLGDREAEQVLLDVDRPSLERIFKELYVGGDRFVEIFGEEPRYYKGVGGMERETPLAGGPHWEAALQHPLGILTGRIPPETRLAMERLGIEGLLDPERIVTDDGVLPVKPDPAGLLHLVGTLQQRPLYYFGDNRDDLSTLVAAREQLGADDLFFVYCLSGSSDSRSVRWFAAEGTSLMAVEVNDALEVLEL
jgi:phosphoglycolate phosphatase-like HAD superfamily hydrolase